VLVVAFLAFAAPVTQRLNGVIACPLARTFENVLQ
jgi:hypothetical protein